MISFSVSDRCKDLPKSIGTPVTKDVLTESELKVHNLVEKNNVNRKN